MLFWHRKRLKWGERLLAVIKCDTQITRCSHLGIKMLRFGGLIILSYDNKTSVQKKGQNWESSEIIILCASKQTEKGRRSKRRAQKSDLCHHLKSFRSFYILSMHNHKHRAFENQGWKRKWCFNTPADAQVMEIVKKQTQVWVLLCFGFIRKFALTLKLRYKISKPDRIDGSLEIIIINLHITIIMSGVPKIKFLKKTKSIDDDGKSSNAREFSYLLHISFFIVSYDACMYHHISLSQ